MVAPLRVVLDTRGRLAGDRRVFDENAATLAVYALDMVPDYPDDVAAFAVPRDGDGLDLHAMLSQLAQRDINEVQVEAGATLCGALLRDGLVDELLLYLAPVLLGDKGRPLFAGLGIEPDVGPAQPRPGRFPPGRPRPAPAAAAARAD